MNSSRLVVVIFLTLTLVLAKEKQHLRTKLKHAVKIFHRQSSQSLQVTTQNGIVEGTQSTTVGTEKIYYAFHGIPYAQPPLANLRFMPPIQPSNWTGIYNATYERSICVQNSDSYTTVGSEDCLYINVYTTQPPSSNYTTLLPVMVWIHGGGFTAGDGNYNNFGPDFLLEDNVLVVTFNYRLGIFGFLSTEDLVAPGNNGLRDQIMALKWVQNNIAAFGGDPKNLTIFGESAGAASVSYLLQTNLTKGLFQRAVMQSGTTLCLWTLSRSARRNAFLTGRRLGIFTDDSNNLVNRLRNVTYTRLQSASSSAAGAINGLDPLNGLVLAPVIEPDHEGAVVTSRSYELLKDGNFNRVPLLLGFNSEEARGLNSVIGLLKLYLITYDIAPEKLVPIDMNIRNDSVRRNVGSLIKLHYVGAGGSLFLSETGFIEYLSDDQFVRPIRQYTSLVSNRVDTYFYEFSYEGNLGNPQRGNSKGVGHAEDVFYLFRVSSRSAVDPSDQRTRSRMVRLWTNFAKYGNPTPVRDPLLQNANWTVASESEKLSYLNIGVNLTMETNPHANDMNFWDYLYENYGIPPYDTY